MKSPKLWRNYSFNDAVSSLQLTKLYTNSRLPKIDSTANKLNFNGEKHTAPSKSANVMKFTWENKIAGWSCTLVQVQGTEAIRKSRYDLKCGISIFCSVLAARGK